MFLRSTGAWERRDDDRRTLFDSAKLPPYSPDNVYVVVYGLLRSNGSSSSSGSADPLSLDFWNTIPEEPKRQIPGSGADSVSCFSSSKSSGGSAEPVSLKLLNTVPEEPKKQIPSSGADSVSSFSGSILISGSAEPVSSDFWSTVPEEPKRDIPAIVEDAFDPWRNIPEELCFFLFRNQNRSLSS